MSIPRPRSQIRGSSDAAKLQGQLVFTEVTAERLKTFCTVPVSLSLSLLLTLLSDPPPVAASQNIHEICPAKRLPFTQSHPLLSASLSILTFWVSLLKGKQKDIQAISFPALKLFTFCTYADPRSDLPEGSRRSCQIQLGAPSKTPSTALAVRRGKSSHSLVDDTQ